MTTKEVIICDVCKEHTRNSTCAICHKDLCENCSRTLDGEEHLMLFILSTHFRRKNIILCPDCLIKVLLAIKNKKILKKLNIKQIRKNAKEAFDFMIK